jgi:hypothetical protein
MPSRPAVRRVSSLPRPRQVKRARAVHSSIPARTTTASRPLNSARRPFGRQVFSQSKEPLLRRLSASEGLLGNLVRKFFFEQNSVVTRDR